MPLNHVDAHRYRAYVLRCWEVGSERPGRPATWRFSLECVETRRKRSFADLGAVVAFLEDELEKQENQAAPTEP